MKFIYMYVHIHLSIHIYIYVYRNMCHVYVSIYTSIYMYVNMYIYIRVHIHIQIYIYIYMYIYIYINVHVFVVCIFICLFLFSSRLHKVPGHSMGQQQLVDSLDYCYRVATISRLLQMIGLFCKSALYKRLHSAKESYNPKEPTNRSHPIVLLSGLFCNQALQTQTFSMET